MALTPGLRMAGLAADQLRWAELNEAWAYMGALLTLLKEMGARVMRVQDPRFRWRADYLVVFRDGDALPLLK